MKRQANFRLFLNMLISILPLCLSAQPETEDPYNNLPLDPSGETGWYDTPYFWIGLVLLLVTLFFVLRRSSRRPPRKFMDRKETKF